MVPACTCPRNARHVSGAALGRDRGVPDAVLPPARGAPDAAGRAAHGSPDVAGRAAHGVSNPVHRVLHAVLAAVVSADHHGDPDAVVAAAVGVDSANLVGHAEYPCDPVHSGGGRSHRTRDVSCVGAVPSKDGYAAISACSVDSP